MLSRRFSPGDACLPGQPFDCYSGGLCWETRRPFAEPEIIETTFVAGVTILRFVDDANQFLKRVDVFQTVLA